MVGSVLVGLYQKRSMVAYMEFLEPVDIESEAVQKCLTLSPHFETNILPGTARIAGQVLNAPDCIDSTFAHYYEVPADPTNWQAFLSAQRWGLTTVKRDLHEYTPDAGKLIIPTFYDDDLTGRQAERAMRIAAEMQPLTVDNTDSLAARLVEEGVVPHESKSDFNINFYSKISSGLRSTIRNSSDGARNVLSDLFRAAEHFPKNVL